MVYPPQSCSPLSIMRRNYKMLWIQIVIFLLVAGGTMTLLNVNFKDFFQLAARGKPSTLKDDLDAIL